MDAKVCKSFSLFQTCLSKSVSSRVGRCDDWRSRVLVDVSPRCCHDSALNDAPPRAIVSRTCVYSTCQTPPLIHATNTTEPASGMICSNKNMQPQRPVRSLRVHDENVPIANQLPGKTIHQRNKSTPALSGLMQYAASRGVVKRTAFADLSNTARVQPAQDDSAINGKIVVNMQDFKQPAALLKPAQRALAAKPSNQQLTAASVTTSSVPVKAAAAVTTASQGQAAVPRKIAPKRSASVLKDAATTVVSVETVTTEQEQDVVPARSATSTTQSTALPELDAITEEAVSAAGPVQPVDAPVASNAVEEHYILALEHQAQAVDVLARNDTIQDEDEEEFHQDECTRNMTTGGVTGTTVVLAPRYTKKVQQELLEARTAVEGSRTEEEVEDEQWDTSMVAEYGDEIFEYMRELEVSRSFVIAPPLITLTNLSP